MITAQMGLEARDNLRFIVASWSALKARLRREGGDPTAGKVGGSSEPMLELDVGVSDLLEEIEAEARSLAYVLMDEAPTTDGRPWGPRTSAMPALLDEVAGHYGHWTAGDERTAYAFMDWAHEYAGKVRATLERPAPPSYMGDCSLTYVTETVRGGRTYLPGDECGGPLYLKAGKGSMRCGQCGQETSVEAQRDHVTTALKESVMTASEVRAALVTVGLTTPWSTIKDWTQERERKDGTKRKARLPDLGEGLYSFEVAMELAQDRRARLDGAA